MPPRRFLKRTKEDMIKRQKSDAKFNLWDKDGKLIIENGKLVEPSKDKKE